MLFPLRRKLAVSAEQLSGAVGRHIPYQTIEAIVQAHRRPSHFAQILSRVLAFEANPRKYSSVHPPREQQKFNHRCDYEGSLRVSEALSLFFDDYDLTDHPAYDADFVARKSNELDEQGYSLIADFVLPMDCDAMIEFLGQDHILFREDLSGRIHNGYTPANVSRATSNVSRIVDQSTPYT